MEIKYLKNKYNYLATNVLLDLVIFYIKFL